MVFIALSGNHEPMRMILITDTGPQRACPLKDTLIKWLYCSMGTRSP